MFSNIRFSTVVGSFRALSRIVSHTTTVSFFSRHASFKTSRANLEQMYVQKMAPQNTPMVVGQLLDLDCSEDFICQLLNSAGRPCPVDELVEQVKKCGVFPSLICNLTSVAFKMRFTPGANISKWLVRAKGGEWLGTPSPRFRRVTRPDPL